MTYWLNNVQPIARGGLAAMPPAMIEETAWDILLTLHADRRCALSLAKLGTLVSVPELVLYNWLALLEQRQLITGAKQRSTQELRATLTPTGRHLIDDHLMNAGDPPGAPN